MINNSMNSEVTVEIASLLDDDLTDKDVTDFNNEVKPYVDELKQYAFAEQRLVDESNFRKNAPFYYLRFKELNALQVKRVCQIMTNLCDNSKNGLGYRIYVR